MLIFGLLLFFVPHFLTMVPAVREPLVKRLGEGPYKGVYSLLSVAGIVLVSIGYEGGGVPLFAPPVWALAVSGPVMALAFVLVLLANPRTHTARVLRHPMSIGIALWACMHLLAAPSVNGLWLFGAFLLYAIASAISAEMRGKEPPATPRDWRWDAGLAAIGLVVFMLVYAYHFRM